MLWRVVRVNEKNLKPIVHLSSEEAKRRGSAGGKKSVESRRRKKSMKSVLTDMLSSDVVSDEIYNAAAEMGVNVMDMTYQAAILAALIKKAASGDVAAVREIRSIIGEDNDAERLRLAKKELALKEKRVAPDDEGAASDIAAAIKDVNVNE